MAQLTTNYGLYKPEATDTYNHLVYDNPNMDTIDAAMKDNSDHAVDNASCIKSGTVHSVTRTNTSCPVFKFTATGDWITGDTMNVDGTPVSVYLPNGTAPLTGCFVINSEVLAIISGSRVTLQCPVIPDASQVAFDNTGTTLSSTDVEGALVELNDSANIVYDVNNSVKDKISAIDQKGITFTELVKEFNVPTTATSYNCDWTDYDALSFEMLFYDNVREQITVPKSYFNTTFAGGNLQMTDGSRTSVIYKNGNNAVYMSMGAQEASRGIRIYGIKLG